MDNFPGHKSDWAIRGKIENVDIGASSIEISSPLPGNGRIIRDWPIEAGSAGSLIGVRGIARATGKYISPVFDGVSGRLDVKETYSEADSRPGILFRHPFVGPVPGQWNFSTISRINPSAKTLNISLVKHTSGSWLVQELQIFTFSYSRLYLLCAAVLICLWLFFIWKLFGIMFRGELPRLKSWKFILPSVCFLLVLIFALVEFNVFRVLSQLLNVQVRVLVDLEKHSRALSLLLSLHILVHFIGTLVLLVSYGEASKSRLRILELAALVNLAVAIGVESLQSHSFTRASQWQDISHAMFGALFAFVLYELVRVIVSVQKI